MEDRNRQGCEMSREGDSSASKRPHPSRRHPQKKKQTGVGFEEIAVIAAEKTSRGVVVANLPPRIGRIVPGKQCLLKASGQVEFALHSIPFLVCQIIETKIQKSVGIGAFHKFML